MKNNSIMKKSINAKPDLDHIFTVQDRKFEEIPVPEWGCTIRISVMSGAGRSEFDQKRIEGEGLEGFMARLIVASAIHEDGSAIFSYDHVELLKGKSNEILMRLAARAAVINGLSQQASEEIAKNSEAGQNSASGIASPATSE